MLWFAENNMHWLTEQQEEELKSLEREYKKYSPAVTFDEYVENYETFKNLTDDLINFYEKCDPWLNTNAPVKIAWRWRNILRTEQRYQIQALTHDWSKHLFKPQMHNMEWWHSTGNPYCVCIN